MPRASWCGLSAASTGLGWLSLAGARARERDREREREREREGERERCWAPAADLTGSGLSCSVGNVLQGVHVATAEQLKQYGVNSSTKVGQREGAHTVAFAQRG